MKSELTERLHAMRDEAKTLLGPRYQAHMGMLSGVIERAALRENTDVMTAAIRMCKSRDLTGKAMIFTMAAAVELLEPSK